MKAQITGNKKEHGISMAAIEHQHPSTTESSWFTSITSHEEQQFTTSVVCMNHQRWIASDRAPSRSLFNRIIITHMEWDT